MRKKSWGEYEKSILDKVIEMFRTHRITRYIKADSIVLDLGCGFNASFLDSVSSKIKRGIGIDISISNKSIAKNILLVNGQADKKINLKSNQFDTITALALIEHVSNPEKMLDESYRLLKQGGGLLITTPSIYGKPILEFLAFKLNIISGEEISDHKRYFDKKSLMNALIGAGFSPKKITVKYFSLGFNLFAKAIK